MQTIRPIPGGPHNPYGHTEASILDALRGRTGSRTWSFRYERWAAGVSLGSIDGVTSCTVEHNQLADIKRKAKLRVRDTGQVNFLSDRIQPWCRLHMPPVVLSPGLHLTGIDGSNASAPHVAAFAITGDLEISAEATRNWGPGGGIRILAAHADADVNPGNLGYYLSLNNEGQLRLTWSTTGSNFITRVATVLPGDDTDAKQKLAVKATLDVDNGAAGHTVTFYTAPRKTGPWEQLGSPVVTAGTTSIFAGVSGQEPPMEAGSRSHGTIQLWTGIIHWIEVRSGIGGAIVADPHFDEQLEGTTSFLDSAGNTWTVNGDASIRGTVVEESSYVEWPMGMFLLSTPKRTSGGAVVTRDVEGYDLLQLYDDDGITARHTVAAGTVYTTAVSTLLGSVPKNITVSTLTLPVSKEWEPGTSKLRIINDLLSEIDYETLSFDEYGVAIVKPYVSPDVRAAEYFYLDDDNGLVIPNVDQELDLFNIPNSWVLVVSDPDHATPLISTYTNSDPASPTSTVNRQRTILDYRQEQEAADQTTLDAKVERLAFEATQIFEALDFKTALMPIHSGNDVYHIRYGPLAVNAKYSEHTWSVELKAGAVMSHRARRVVNI